MYFPNAFKKVFVAKSPLAGSPAVATLSLATTGTTANLTAGQIGLFDAKSYAAITAAPSTGNQTFILAQGSYHTVDKIGPTHGGYKESIKSKVINPKYVSRFFSVAAQTPLNQKVIVGWDKTLTGATTSVGPKFECGKTYNLRLDIKGSPALRFLSHNLYKTFDVFTGCCADDCSSGCSGDPVDAAFVLLQLKDKINADPIVSQFIQAKVYKRTESGSPLTAAATEVSSSSYTQVTDNTADAVADIVAGLYLEVAYTDTTFGNCTFTVSDKYDLEPLFVFASFVDETGNPCAVKNTANTSTGVGVTELQTPRQASGIGETVLRDLILSQRYLQEPFPDGNSMDQLRLREVLDDPSLSTITRSSLYDQICILHNVPRLNNSTSIFDNDQYLLVINVATGADTDALTDLIQDILDLAGNGIELEEY